MAIIEKETGKYIKVLFEECMIKGVAVVCCFAVYDTRKIEKKKKYANRCGESFRKR